MTKSIADDEARIFAIVEEQIGYFVGNRLIEPLSSREILLGEIALSCTATPSMYRNLSAKLTDNPGKDELSVLVDPPTIGDMVEEISYHSDLTEEDIVRLSVGSGIANLLIYSSFVGPAKLKKMTKIVEALSEPQGLYARTMESKIFDDIGADETASAISVEGHRQTANVNATRLTTGMFIEVQPNAKELRKHVEEAFQSELSALFDGKEAYIQNAGLFNVEPKDAQDLYSNSVEVMLGLSFPMMRKEVGAMLKLLR